MTPAIRYYNRKACFPTPTLGLSFAVILFLFSLDGMEKVGAQTTSPITPSGLNTHISTPITLSDGTVQHNITGGTRADGNLFHSFGNFNVPKNNIANFLNETALPTTNILGRVTAGNPSAIFGQIQTTGFHNANLFLMNPAGIIFGPNASLSVGGSVVFTTASYLRLAEMDGTKAGLFHSSPTSTSVLTSAPLSAFGFLSSPVGIALSGSTLSLKEGQSFTLVGGSSGFTFANPDNGAPTSVSGGVTLKAGTLLASGGTINVASVASSGEISSGDLNPSSGLAMGTIHITDSSLLNSSGQRTGSIKIRGGSFVMDESTLSADSSATNGNPLAIDINLTGNLTIANSVAPALTAHATGDEPAGGILLKARSISAQSATDDIRFALIDTHTSGAGRAGNVTILTDTLTAEMANNGAFFIDSGTTAQGNGGNVSINADAVQLRHAHINAGDSRAIASDLPISDIKGLGGSIAIGADTILLHSTGIASQIFQGHGGDVSLTGHEVTLNGASLVSTSGVLGSGGVLIDAHRFTMTQAAQIEALTAFSPGRDVVINAGNVELSDGSTIRTQTGGPEAAGSIIITATDGIKLSGEEASVRPSGFYSNSLAIEDVDPSRLGGNAGSITITTGKLAITGGARIDTTTQTSGRGGNVTITATDSVTITGERTEPIPEDFFAVGSNTAGGIFTRTIGSESCSGACGDAGQIRITTGSFTLGRGSLLDSSTTTAGRGGDLVLDVAGWVSISESLADGSPVGIFSRSIGTTPDAGSGGNISLTAGQSVTIQDGASVSASSTGPADAGNIFINAGQQLDVRDSPNAITTEAAKASGGNIDIRAIDRIRFVNSSISTSVLSADGSGGNIFIDPKVVILEGSNVTAEAVGGPGGNITFVTPLFLADSVSTVSASSERGPSGTVTIQSPTANLSGAVGQLVSKASPPQVLLQNRCVALAGGEQSTFILAGRNTLPVEPGGWLSSPVSMEHWTGVSPEHASTLMVQSPSRRSKTWPAMITPKSEANVLSLRRLTPPGFLVRAFATPSTGCPS